MRSQWVLFIASLVMGAMGIISLAIGALAGLGARYALDLEMNGGGMWTVILIVYGMCLWGLLRVARPYQLILRLLRR